MLPADNVGAICSCLECRAAGVTQLRRIRVPADEYCSTARWLHGEELRRWHEERAAALGVMRARLQRPR